MNRRRFLDRLRGLAIAGLAGGIAGTITKSCKRSTPVAHPKFDDAHAAIVIPQRRMYARIRISPELIEASRHAPPGAYWSKAK